MGNEQSSNIEATKNGKIHEKHENGSVNGISASITPNGPGIEIKSKITDHLNSELQTSAFETGSTENGEVKLDALPANSPVVSEITEAVAETDEVKKGKEQKSHLFGKLFKKKEDRASDGEKAVEKEKDTSNEDQVDVAQLTTVSHQEAANLKPDSESRTELLSGTPDSSPEGEEALQADNGHSRPVESQEESNPEDNPVMNFFKTLVTSTKTSKKETVAPDAIKDQSLKETQPAATTTAAQISEPPAAPKGMPVPPPPPPEPPKMEVKGEATAKPVKPAPKEEPKAAGKETEPSKGKSTKDTLSKFFRPKQHGDASSPSHYSKQVIMEKIKGASQPTFEAEIEKSVELQQAAVEVVQQIVEVQMVENVPQPVIEAEKVDPSKAGTLEAAAKPEPPAPVQEDKKTSSKSSFLSIFKPKVLLDHMTTKVQAASTSGVQLFRKTTGLAAEPKKTSSTSPAAAEAAQGVKAKEEPKTAAKSSEAVVDNKPVSAASQAGEEAVNLPKKLEKRNSIQLFFKNLGQKRHSTDAGVQTEPVTVAPAAEKAK